MPRHSLPPVLRPSASPLIALAVALTLSACGSDSSTPFTQPGYDLSKAKPAPYESHGSVRQLWLVSAAPSQPLELTDPSGHVLQQATADDQGSLLLRDLVPGTYRIVSGGPSALVASDPLVVTDWQDHPDADAYAEQKIGPGYGYLRTRDGTLLSINVYLPGPPENGPYPTVIEYSGYDPANPEAKQPGTLIATTLGYAAVGVNIRGTGCSGGVFEFFEQLQSTDGYDVIETIAAQDWVKGHKVGMVGASYSGITQLFVAQLAPPSLAAITPLAVISDTGRGVLRPGGIFNDGFALS
ncbi:MAG: CocE/NonD family hydrolase, partial [Alphaproteobacteria bacterium]